MPLRQVLGGPRVTSSLTVPPCWFHVEAECSSGWGTAGGGGEAACGKRSEGLSLLFKDLHGCSTRGQKGKWSG